MGQMDGLAHHYSKRVKKRQICLYGSKENMHKSGIGLMPAASGYNSLLFKG